MENEILSENQQNFKELIEYFKLDFPTQKLKGNRQFEEYKYKKLKDLGKDAKLFHCKIDNIYFYLSKEDCKTYPFYYKKCPLCNNYICYFCERCTEHPINEKGNCCPKLRLYYLFFVIGFKPLNKFNRDCLTIMSIFPIYSAVSYSIIILNVLFFELKPKHKRMNKYEYIENTYNSYLMNSFCFGFTIFITSLFGEWLLNICYSIYDAYFKIFLLVVSLFTKFCPFKYFISIAADASLSII